VETNVERVNSSLRMDFHNAGANEWIGFRLETIGALVLCASALLLVFLPSNIIKPGITGATYVSLFHFNASRMEYRTTNLAFTTICRFFSHYCLLQILHDAYIV
jgi:hypothetical protein